MYKFRRDIVVLGGSAQFGADTNLYRSAANTLKTDDSLVVGGSLLTVPYGNTSPALASNGDMAIYHKANVARLAIRSGGTIYTLQFAVGTATFTAGTAAP